MLALMLGFVRFRITNPCVFSEPLVRCIAMRTVGLTEKYRAGAEGAASTYVPVEIAREGFGQRIIRIPITLTPSCSLMGVLPLRYDERIKGRRRGFCGG